MIRRLGTQIRPALATLATKPKGSQFVLRAQALHGNFFDGHTLSP
jgi:transposase, IS5 family